MVATGIKNPAANGVVVEEKDREANLANPTNKLKNSNSFSGPLETMEIASETSGIEEIRKRFQEAELEGICFRGESLADALQRYLQARKFDVDKTEKCIRDSLHWRLTYAAKCVADGKQKCLGCDVEEIVQFYPGSYAQNPDKLGRHIWYEKTGAVDSYALNTVTTNEKFIRYHVCLMEVEALHHGLAAQWQR